MALRVGVVRDERYLEHKPGLVHPESPGRLRSVYRMLDRYFADRLIMIEPEPATLEDLELVHTPAYIDQILGTVGRDFTALAPDTYLSARTYEAAWLAAGGGIKAMESVMKGECRAAFALVRPPGHHALPDRAGGFCIFNNLGIVARRAIESHGVNRILIIDWDIHHGNAIQDLFYNDNRVFYLSSHYMGWYPHTGDWDETGEGPGVGYTVNIIVPKSLRDDDIIHIYREVLGPIFRRYRPELVLVAAGFDAHERDPLGRTKLSETAYRWLTQMVLQWCDTARHAPLMLSLEGGYDNRALAASIREVLGVLAHEGRLPRVPVVKTDTGRTVLQKVIEIHRKHNVWVG